MLNNIKRFNILFTAIIVLLVNSCFIGNVRPTVFNYDIDDFIVNLNIKDTEEHIVFYADEILKGNMYVHQDIKEPLKFNISDDGIEIDWNASVSNSLNTFQLRLQSLSPLSILCLAYKINNNGEYLSMARKILMSWFQYFNSEEMRNNKMVWNDHVSALRTNNLIYFALTMNESKQLDKNLENEIIELLNIHGNYLYDDQHYTRNHNHGIFQDESLLAVSYLLQNNNFKQWNKKAEERLVDQFNYAFNDEGFHVENSSSYFIGVQNTFLEIIDFINRVDKDSKFVESFQKQLNRTFNVLSWMIKPDGRLTSFGDSVFFEKKYNLPESQIAKDNVYMQYVTTDGLYGEDHKTNSVVFPESGFYFYRGNNSDFSMNTWKMFKGGYESSTHKHADDLSFLMSTKGKDIFIDPGMYNYMTSDFYRDYFVSSKAHNTVVVDGKSYSTQVEERQKVGIMNYYLSDEYDYIEGYNHMFAGAEIYRNLYSAGDITVIYDDIYSEDYHNYSQQFHISNDTEIVSEKENELLLKIKDTDYYVRITSLVPSDKRIIHGEMTSDFEPLTDYGYMSKQLNELETINTLLFNQSGTSVKFITLITIEDKNGLVYAGNDYISKDDIIFNNDCFLIGDKLISMNCERINTNYNVDIIDDNLFKFHSLDNNQKNKHKLTIYDRYSHKSIVEDDLLEENDFVFELSNPYDLIATYEISKDFGSYTKVLFQKNIALIKYDFADLNYYEVVDGINVCTIDSEYEIVDLDNNRYRFTVTSDYILDYEINWYIYKDGVYYKNFIYENNNSLDFSFTKNGLYSVQYYLTLCTGEKYFYYYPMITVNTESDISS